MTMFSDKDCLAKENENIAALRPSYHPILAHNACLLIDSILKFLAQE